MRIALLCIILLLQLKASAQHLPITVYSSRDGAPVIGANSIYQDRQGWIWFTDGYHLLRYDGHRFKNYYPQKKYRIEFVFQVTEIGNETWALAYPYPFKVVGDSLVAVNPELKIPQILHTLRFHGRQYILANSGLYYFDEGAIKEFIIDSNFHFGRVNPSLVSYNDSLLLSFNSKRQLVLFDVTNRKYHLIDLNVDYIRQDQNGKIFFNTRENDIYILKALEQSGGSWIAKTDHYLKLPWKKTHAAVFEIDPAGNLWATEQFKRLIRVSPDKRITSFTEKDGLPSLWFNYLMIDKEGQLWLGSNGGICKIRQSGWERYTSREGLSFNHATFFANGEKDSVIFIGTQDGINLFNQARVMPIRKNGEILRAYCLQQVGRKVFYTHDSSLYQASINEDQCIVFNEKLVAMIGGEGIEMAKDKRGSLFISVRGGISIWNGSRHFFFKVGPSIFREFLVDSRGDLWAGSFGEGLFRFAVQYDGENVSLKQLNYLEKVPGSNLPLAAVRAIAEDKHGNIIAGTRYNGIFYINMKNDLVDSIHHFYQIDGLISNSIWGIGVSKNNEVWIGSALGLNQGTWKNGKFLIKDVSKINQIYSTASIFVDRHNSVWVATHPGVTRLIQESAITSPFSVYITRVLLDERSTVNKTDTEFNHTQNNFILEFSSNTYLDEKAVAYSYRLVKDGDETWTEPQPVHSVNYSSLKPGEYRFQVKAMNIDGRWSDNIAEYSFEIRPPFWQTPWFIALVVLLVGAGLYALYRYRISQLLRLQEVRNNISRNLHDDIGASLSNINILNELAKRNMRDETKAGLYLSKAGEDIQRISESLSDIVWNINPRYDDLENLFIRMKRYAADMLEGKNISAELLFPVVTHPVSLPMDQRRDFYLIFKEAVNNLVKYSKATQALVEVELNSHFINLLIRDNGKGFDSDKSQPGNGLYNMKQRADKWKGNFAIESLSGEGTVVKVSMRI